MKRFIVAVLILSLCTPCWAATQLKKTVKPSGGDYTSLEACMNDNEQNLVTADKYFDVEIDGSWSSADTTVCTIENYTTDATRYINIYTTATARHNGKEQAVSGLDSYRLIITDAASNTSAIAIASSYVSITGLEISIYDVDTAYRAYYGISKSSTAIVGILIDSCIIHDVWCLNYTSLGSGINHARTINVRNCILYNLAAHGIYENSGYGQNQIIENNTVYNYNLGNSSYLGIRTLSTNANNLYKNNLVIAGSNGGDCYAIAAGCTLATNGSSDTTGTSGLQNLTTSEFVNVSAGSEDLHLASGATSIGAGTDLSGTFTTDIDGDTRSSWDIGADEYVSAGPATDYYSSKGLFRGIGRGIGR